MLRPRILTGLVVAVVAGVFASQVASCTLDQEGTIPVETGRPCQVDANCDDGNPCMKDRCPTETLVCEYTPEPDGPAPAAVQTTADCRSIVCNAGTPSTVDDVQDFVNDNNSCTADKCEGGVSKNEILPDDTSCNQGTKTGKCAAGTCTISCMNNNDCDDGNPCTDDLCNTSASVCAYTSLHGVPTPGVTDTVGDCKLRICDNGVDVETNVDDDVNDDNNPCTTDICTMGVPSNPNVLERTPCTPGDVNVCDGQGACVPCVVADDCVTITETECERRSCVNNTCVIAYQGNDTLADPTEQTDGDCQKVVCNGNNGTTVLLTSLPDDADLPFDNNPCTKDICTNGVPTNPFEAANFVCGNNPTQYCNATGQCVGCTAASQCMGTDTFCQIRTCNNGVCGVMNTPNNTDLPMADQTAGDCKVRECNGNGGIKTSTQTSDIPVDGNPCTQDICTNQTPSNPPSPINSSCSVGDNDACDGNGNCKKSLGKMCGAGTECVSTRCVDSVCCGSACTTLCRACNVPGSEGTCTEVPKGQDDASCTGSTQSCNAGQCDYEIGQPCAGSTSCLSDFCVDGVCCNSACDTACKSCNVTGNVGTCSNLPAMSQDNAPTNLCIGMNQCDGMGVCKKTVGAPCDGDSECLNNMCVDGVCCATACTEECKSCNVSGSAGTCTNVAMGNDDGACMGNKSCDGMGVCKGEQGASCTDGATCFSTFCVDGFCCNNACTSPCSSCAASESDGPDGTCSPVTAGTDPGNDCAPEMMSTCGNNGFCDGAGMCQKYAAMTVCAPQSCMGSTQTDAGQCNGTGTCVPGMTTDCSPYKCNGTSCAMSCTVDGDCIDNTYYCSGMMCLPKKDNGQMCTGGGNQCTSGNCVDGYCCNSSCTTQCMDCDVGGSQGTCTVTPQYTNDGCPANETCNGNAANPDCDLVNGQMCGSNGQCASNNCTGAPPTCQP